MQFYLFLLICMGFFVIFDFFLSILIDFIIILKFLSADLRDFCFFVKKRGVLCGDFICFFLCGVFRRIGFSDFNDFLKKFNNFQKVQCFLLIIFKRTLKGFNEFLLIFNNFYWFSINLDNFYKICVAILYGFWKSDIFVFF